VSKKVATLPRQPRTTKAMAPLERTRDASYAGLFQRFAGDAEGDPRVLAAELADLLSARPVLAERGLGVLSWGMPPLTTSARACETDREYIAQCIADSVQRFEPRLDRVQVTPTEDAGELSFVITASLVAESSTIELRIFSPRAKAGFGGRIEVVQVGDAIGNGALG